MSHLSEYYLHCSVHRWHALHRLSRPLLIVALLLLSLGLTVTAYGAVPGFNPYDATQGSVWLQAAGQSHYEEALQLDTDVTFDVSGPIARAVVKQRFRNNETDWAEGLYVFPLPEGAAVDHFRLRIGDQVIEGQVKERIEAKRTYERAKSEGKRAGLMQQQRPNIFTTSLANIAPGEELLIEIEYQQSLEYRDGVYRLRFPLVVGPRFSKGAVAGDIGSDVTRYRVPRDHHDMINPVHIQVALDAGIPAERPESLYHPVQIKMFNDHQYLVSLDTGQVPADHDFELTWRPTLGQFPRPAVFQEQEDGSTYTLLTVFPPDLAALGQQLLPRDLVFVIDVSGSMEGASMDQAKRALNLALARLTPNDRFNVIWFNNRVGSLYPAVRLATGEAIRGARHYVGKLEADGGTEMLPAIVKALNVQPDPSRLRQVIFLTDGDVSDERALFDAITDHLGKTRLFTIGIGSAPNGYFMRKAARAGRGTFTYIGDSREVQQKMDHLLEKLEMPALVDIRLDMPDAYDEVFPDPIPDLYAGETVSMVLRSESPPVAATMSGFYGESPWEITLPLTEVEQSRGIRVAWAREKLDHLMEAHHDADDEGVRDTVRRDVIETAIEHHLMSPFTSFVAVDVTPARAGAVLRTHSVKSALPQGWTPVSIGLPQTATASLRHFMVGFMVLLIAIASAAWRKRS